MESVSDLDVILRSLWDPCTDFLRRRISWKELGIALENCVEDLELDQEEVGGCHRKVKPILKLAMKEVPAFLARIDSGNKPQAEEVADQKSAKLKATDG